MIIVMKFLKLIGSILVILFGVFMFIFGGYDDSPGAQLLGVLLVIGGIVVWVKSRKKNA